MVLMVWCGCSVLGSTVDEGRRKCSDTTNRKSHLYLCYHSLVSHYLSYVHLARRKYSVQYNTIDPKEGEHMGELGMYVHPRKVRGRGRSVHGRWDRGVLREGKGWDDKRRTSERRRKAKMGWQGTVNG